MTNRSHKLQANNKCKCDVIIFLLKSTRTKSLLKTLVSGHNDAGTKFCELIFHLRMSTMALKNNGSALIRSFPPWYAVNFSYGVLQFQVQWFPCWEYRKRQTDRHADRRQTRKCNEDSALCKEICNSILKETSAKICKRSWKFTCFCIPLGGKPASTVVAKKLIHEAMPFYFY